MAIKNLKPLGVKKGVETISPIKATLREMFHGQSIFLDGPDFTGKTTTLKRIAKWFKEYGVNVDTRYQPGATDLGKDCRELIFHKPYSKTMDKMAERMLFSVDHADFVPDIDLNKKQKKSLILCDRYNPMSNIVYGVYGLKMLLWDIKLLNKLACRNVLPDMIIVLDITEETMLERMRIREEEVAKINEGKDQYEQGKEIKKFDDEKIDFKRRIIKGYKEIEYFIGEEYEGRIFRVDANGTPDEVFSNVLDCILYRYRLTESEIQDLLGNNDD